MTFWDFDENKNFVTVFYKNIPFKVLNLQNKLLAAKRLYEAKLLIDSLADKVRTNILRVDPVLQEMSTVFLSIHPDYYYLQEMQMGTEFDGMNKPKNVKKNDYLPSVGKDKLLKAEYRIVFLNLRKPDLKIKTLKELIPLIIHEIAHTGCNHVTWKDNNHYKDFQLFESYLYYLLSSTI